MAERMDLGALARRVYRESVQDGLVDLTLGVFLLLAAALFSTRQGGGLAILLFLVALVLGGPVLGYLRQRYTYPRIGYVQLLPEEPRQAPRGFLIYMAAAMAGWIGVLAVVGVIDHPTRWYGWTPLLVGCLTVGGFVHMVSRSGLLRYAAYAAVSVASGVAFSLLGFPGRFQGLAWYLLATGLAIILGGAITFARFVHNTPVRKEGHGDGAA